MKAVFYRDQLRQIRETDMNQCTKEREYILKHLASIFHTGVFCLRGDECIPYEENPAYNPLYNSEALRGALRDSAGAQREPVLVRDDFHMIYICVREENICYMMGPLSMQVMSRTERHRFYHFYGIDEKWEKGLHYHTLMEILQIAGMFVKIITGQEYTDQELMDANYRVVDSAGEKREQAWFDIRSEDEDIYRHSYQEERRILDAVKEGNVEEAVRLSKDMDSNIGRLGKSELEHWKNLSIVAATLCARAAIEGGVMPAAAYRLSGFYINRCTACEDVAQILIYRNHAVEELAKRVREQKEKCHTSSYTEQCKDYVYRRYREKVYLDDIADTLGISSSYLSRLFRRETGISLQDFVNDVRVEKAANLLIYSEETLPGIAEYVNFPSQSYFGKVFKQKTGMTPKQYRKLHKPAEFYGKEGFGQNKDK